jgi:signal transduction histidine kinase
MQAVTVQVEGTERKLEPAQELAAYRIVQEAWSNVLRHARARHVVITIQYTREGLFVGVRDDGAGFSPERTGRGRASHWGLRGMQERAELAGGTLELRSTPGSGTELIAYLPLPCAPERLPVPLPRPSLQRTRRGGRAVRPMVQLV